MNYITQKVIAGELVHAAFPLHPPNYFRLSRRFGSGQRFSCAQIAVRPVITIAPPAISDLCPPVIRAPGYLWTRLLGLMVPTGYYWVPGTWWNRDGLACCGPPPIGVSEGRQLRLPRRLLGSAWGFFYGGINYGSAMAAIRLRRRWGGGAFSYNTAVMNVGVNIVPTNRGIPCTIIAARRLTVRAASS